MIDQLKAIEQAGREIASTGALRHEREAGYAILIFARAARYRLEGDFAAASCSYAEALQAFERLEQSTSGIKRNKPQELLQIDVDEAREGCLAPGECAVKGPHRLSDCMVYGTE